MPYQIVRSNYLNVFSIFLPIIYIKKIHTQNLLLAKFSDIFCLIKLPVFSNTGMGP